MEEIGGRKLISDAMQDGRTHYPRARHGHGTVRQLSVVEMVEYQISRRNRDEPDPRRHGPVKIIVKDGKEA